MRALLALPMGCAPTKKTARTRTRAPSRRLREQDVAKLGQRGAGDGAASGEAGCCINHEDAQRIAKEAAAAVEGGGLN